jgi:geranylgeranyl pyrophosphate synthase
LAKLLEGAGAIAHAQKVAASLVARGKGAIEKLPPSAARESLMVMADAVITRRF